MNRERPSPSQAMRLNGEEVGKHRSKESCWVIVHGRAYDVTDFLPGKARDVKSTIEEEDPNR